MYEQGLNISLANLFFYTFPSLGGSEFFIDLLTRWQRMLRLRTRESYDAFFELAFQEQNNDQLNEMLQFLQFAHVRFGYDLFQTIPEDTLDLAVTMTLTVMASWRSEISGAIHLVHDKSSNMSDQKEVWDALMDPNLPPATVGYDRRTMTFPISVERTRFERSERWAGLQLSDVLAGAMERYAKWIIRGQKPEDSYGNELSKIVGEFSVFPLWPDRRFTKDELGTTGEQVGDALEYFATNIYGDRKTPSGDL